MTISYQKSNKLIAALYMVTDIMDTHEPIRNKLRTLGTEVISDIYLHSSQKDKPTSNLEAKISEILSFLDIASMVQLVSEMNHSILKKEFLKLKDSLKDNSPEVPSFGGQVLLSDFMKDDKVLAYKTGASITKSRFSNAAPTRIGVQKGNTLMQALSDRMPGLSDRITPMSFSGETSIDFLKKERREEIIKIIKGNGVGTTITDIKTKAHGSLASSSEKTLQRELVAMVRDGVLEKTGEKRWSRYYVSQ